MRIAIPQKATLPADSALRAWNTLIAQPWKIMSFGLREWAYIGRSI